MARRFRLMYSAPDGKRAEAGTVAADLENAEAEKVTDAEAVADSEAAEMVTAEVSMADSEAMDVVTSAGPTASARTAATEEKTTASARTAAAKESIAGARGMTLDSDRPSANVLRNRQSKFRDLWDERSKIEIEDMDFKSWPLYHIGNKHFTGGVFECVLS